MDLLNMLLSSFTSDNSVNALSGKTGIDKSKITSLIMMALPLIIKALTKNASSSSGASSLLGALTQHTSRDAIDRQIADADAADGEAILNHILGDDAASVTSGLAAQTGLTNEQVTGTLNNVAPAILSELSAATTQVQKKGGVDLSDGLDFSDLMGMFSGIQSAQSQSNQGGGLLSGLVGALLGGKQEEKPQVQQSSGASAMDLLSGLMGSGAGSTGGLANLLGGDADEASFNGASLLSSLLGK